MPKWLVAVIFLIGVAASISEVRTAVTNWMKGHPALFGPALIFAAIAVLLFAFVKPFILLFVMLLAIAAGISTVLDPKTYSTRKPPD